MSYVTKISQMFYLSMQKFRKDPFWAHCCLIFLLMIFLNLEWKMCFSQTTMFSYAESVNFHELAETIPGLVSILLDWLNNNKLVAHGSKTILTSFTSQIHLVLPNICFNQNSFQWVSHIKYKLENSPTTNYHSNNILHINIVHWAKYEELYIQFLVFVNRESLLKLYYSLVYSRINQSEVIRVVLLKIISQYSRNWYPWAI